MSHHRPFRMWFNPQTQQYEPQRDISAEDFWNEYYEIRYNNPDPLAAYDYVIESLLDDIIEENGYYPDAQNIINRIRRNLDK